MSFGEAVPISKKLAKALGISESNVKSCIKQVAKEKQVSISFLDETLLMHFIVDPMLKGVVKKFQLSEFESDILKRYIDHVHIESRSEFAVKLYRSDRSYLDQFLNTEFEEFGESVFGGEEEEDTTRHHTDLYQLRREKDSTKYLLLYQAVLQKLRQLPTEQYNAVMANTFGFSSTSTNKLVRRKTFYKSYLRYIDSLTQESFEWLVDQLFSPTANPFT